MNKSIPKKVCKCCRHVFIPQFSDEDMLALYYTEEQVENMRMMAEENPMHFNMPQVPTQELCLGCAINPGLRVENRMFGPARYYIEKPERKELKKVRRLDVRAEPPSNLRIFSVSSGEGLSESVKKAMEQIISEKKKRSWWCFWK